MPRIDIPRLDLEVKGLDAAVVRAALDRLPADLAAALTNTPATTAHGTIHVAPGADPAALASALASRIAAVVRARTTAPAAARTGSGGDR